MEAHLSGAQHLKTQLNKELHEKGKVKMVGPFNYIKFEDHERKHEPKKKPKRLRYSIDDVTPISNFLTPLSTLHWSKGYPKNQTQLKVFRFAGS